MKLYHQISFIVLLVTAVSSVFSQDRVVATIDENNLTASLSNGIISITINSKGHVNSLNYNGKDLINASQGGRLYFSYNDQHSYSELSPDNIRIEMQTDDCVEVVYSRTSGSLLLEQGFIMRNGISGIYSYIIIKGSPLAIKLREMRVVYRVDPERFTYGYVTDLMQGEIPSVSIMKQVDSNPIMDATYRLPDGSVYTKYNWANYNTLDSVHGIMTDAEGVWAIPVSNEYMNGGPMKQELTVHATNKTPLVLQMLQGEHFGASAQIYRDGDQKIYGPFFMYVNSGSNHDEMIADAQHQASIQMATWPFEWFKNDMYPLDRTTVRGQIKLLEGMSREGIQVILAQPDGDIYSQGKKYMFWDKTDTQGNFEIQHVRQGDYTLYAYATQGEITNEFSKNNISVSGSKLDLGEINWTLEQREKVLWQIGENDRLTEGFRYSDTIRNYGLYELPPANLEFVVGTSDPSKDWYYAQTKEGSWTIKFNIDEDLSGNVTLTASIAGAANSPEVIVYINGSRQVSWPFSNDASIYRSALLSGKHTLRTVTFSASLLVKGENEIRLAMSNVGNRGGVMYDCIKLEAGELITDISDLEDSNHAGLSVICYPNPFSIQNTIELNASKSQQISIAILNVQGQLVKKLYNGWCEVGKNQFAWTPQNLSNGTYFYQVKTPTGIFTEKMVLLKKN